MYGFMHGLNHQVVQDAVNNRSRDPVHDQVVGTSNHRELIVNNQDITHRHLKEWESGCRYSKTQPLKPLKINNGPFN